jgi:hypothetical protein
MHRDKDHVVVGHQLDGNFDFVHHRERRAVSGMNGIRGLTVNYAAPQVHQPWHPKAPELRARHLPRVGDLHGVVAAEGIDCVVDFGDMHGQKILSTGCRPFLAYTLMISDTARSAH